MKDNVVWTERIFYSMTIDHQTLEDDTITVRHRDTQKQDRVSTDKLFDVMNESL